MDPSLDYNYPYSFTSFGDLLKYLRRRQKLTQLELSITVGYSEAQISRLEKNQRLPDLTALSALFIPALQLENEPQLAARFLELAQSARQEDAPAPGFPPYKGLLFFEESDANLFFGREALTERLTRHVMEIAMSASRRFLVVVGASGSGKSSIVRAGLAVALHRAGWVTTVFTPTTNPLRIFETKLSTHKESAERILILVDQFEELFTLCHDEIERIAFIEKLLSLAQHQSKIFMVVIALRADFYSHCAQYPLLRQAVAAEQEYIGQMTLDELRRAIEEPARHAGWEFEPGLVDLLLNEIGAQGSQDPEPGALPLLSHALLATWERRRGRTFTLMGYRASGGVRGAVAETAESVFADQLNQMQQELARDVFLRLTELGDGTEDTRRRATLKELVRQPEKAAELRTVLNILAEARLITLNEDSAEVAHEALIREWQRLHDWLTQNRDGLLLHRHLTSSALEWDARGRDPSELYRGARLAQAREWAIKNEQSLNAPERAFLTASIEQEEHDVIERETQRKRELEAAHKLAEARSIAARQLHRRAIFLTSALTLAIMLAGVAIFFGYQANRIALEARSRELASAAISNLEDDPERSILLALQAESTTHTIESENTLHRSILASRVMLVLHHNAEVWSVTYSPDGKRIATASQDKTAKVWDATTGQLLLTFDGHTGSVNGVAYSPDGKRIATTSDDHTARVWDAVTGDELLTLTGHKDWVFRIAFNSEGTRLATASNDKTVKIWDTLTGKELLSISQYEQPFFDVAFSPDGKQIAASGFDGNVRVWDAISGQEQLVLPVEQGSKLRGVAFSPDGTRVAAAGYPRGKVWSATTGEVLISGFNDHRNELIDITFSEDGKLIATASADNKAKVWDAVTGQVIYTLSGHTQPVNGVAFNPEGTRLATASWDHTVRVWDITPAKEVLFIPISPPWSQTFSYSPDGTKIVADYPEGNVVKLWDANSGKDIRTFRGTTDPYVLTVYSQDGKMIAGRNDNSIVVWDAMTGDELLTLSGSKDRVFCFAFSPDGTHLASGTSTGEIDIWDLNNGNISFILQEPTVGSSPLALRNVMNYAIFSVAYNPSGKQLVSTDSDGFGIVWDVATGEKLFIIPPKEEISGTTYLPEEILDAAYSPDRRLLALVGSRGTGRILETSNGTELFSLKGHTGALFSVAFNHDGNLVATGSLDGTVRLWDANNGENLLTLPVSGGVSFSPDGKHLAVGGESGVYIFVLPIEDLISLAKSRLTRSLTNDECQQYLHFETCPADP